MTPAFALKPYDAQPSAGDDLLVSRDSISSRPLRDGTIQIERRADRLTLDRFISGEYVNLAAYALRARDWTMVSGAAAVANEIPSPWGRDRCDMIAMASDAADGISQDITTEAATYNFSAYAKLDTGTGNIRLSNGTPGSNIAINSTSWTRIDNNFDCAAEDTTFSIINSSGGSAQNVYLWGMQVTKSKFPLRLVFGSNLNEITGPTDLANAAWLKTGTTVSQDGDLGVYARNAEITDKITADSDNRYCISSLIAALAGEVWCVSYIIKIRTLTGKLYLAFGDAAVLPNPAFCYLSYDGTTLITEVGEGVGSKVIDTEIIPLENGFTKINLRFLLKANKSNRVRLYFTKAGDIVDVDCVYAYAQLYDEACMLDAPSDRTGLVSSYAYDNAEGYDDNTGSADGTNHGAVLQGDGSFVFGGSGYITTAGDNDYSQERTYSFWAKSSKTTKNSVFCHGSITQGAFSFNYSAGFSYFILNSQNWAKWSCGAKEDDGFWHHYLIYYKGNAQTDIQSTELWIDGLQIAQSADDHTNSPLAWDALSLGTGSPATDDFTGSLREFNVFTGKLTEARIQGIVSAGMNQKPVYEYPETIANEASAYTSDDTDVTISQSFSSGICPMLGAIISRPSGAAIDSSRETEATIIELMDAAAENGVSILLDTAEDDIRYRTRTSDSDDTELSLDDSDIKTAIANGLEVAIVGYTYNGTSFLCAMTESQYLQKSEPASSTDSNDRSLPAATTIIRLGASGTGASPARYLDGCIHCTQIEEITAHKGREIEQAKTLCQKLWFDRITQRRY